MVHCKKKETKKREKNPISKVMWNHGREKQKKVEMEGKDSEIQCISLQ